jgi:hypothetical protein
MPIDTWGSRLEGQVSDFDRWISALQVAPTKDANPAIANCFTEDVKQEIIRYFVRERDSVQRQLLAHRQRNKELGIKF